MSRHFTVLFFIFLFVTVGFVQSARAQDMLEQAARRTEKFRQKIKGYGTGEKIQVTVELFDGKKYKGYISESNDQTFTVVDKKGVPQTISYSNVKEVIKKKNASALTTGIVIGAGAAAAVTLIILFRLLGG
ncbi:MAG: hypothetical protein JSS81_00680 [Acidobacteria bacterium]|nr:hypothetical protein [Acidobacteriota bacterium]